MAELSDLRWTEYERFSPTFWRKTEGAVEGQKTYSRALLGRSSVIAIEWNEGEVEGFIIGNIVPLPPVYDPGKNSA